MAQIINFKVIDLSRTISEGMPVYPGTEPPTVMEANTIENDGFAEKIIRLYSHTGTHIDAPCHIIKGAPSLEELGIEHFTGSGIMLDLYSRIKESRDIELSDLLPFKASIGAVDFVLFKTSWSGFWGTQRYFDRYPLLSMDAAKWLSGFKLKGIGVDMISIDANGSPDMPIHRTFLEKDIVIVENLTNLEPLAGRSFIFCCFPLKMKGSDGSPARAVALIENSQGDLS